MVNARLRPRAAKGFTLIEVMLAITITAFVALLAYNGLSAALTAGERHSAQAQQLADIQLPLTILERDIRHAIFRPIRDEYDETIAALTGSSSDQYLLRLTRRGWDNPRGLPRGDLQRVRYRLENQQLWRESWSVLDRVSEEDSLQRTLLMEGVVNVELSFLDSKSAGASSSPLGGEWVELWEETDRLPLAVQITFEIDGFGEVRRVFSIPSE
jgi:general secretion pathway protein J